MSEIPAELKGDIGHARRLAWWTLFWMTSVTIVMWLVMGSSQVMKTALIEDLLSLIPAAVFLIGSRFEGKQPSRRFSFGFHRVHSLSSLIAAVALTAVGALLLFDSGMTLYLKEHATIPPITLFGQQIWSGWLMVAGLLYSVIPPVILGHKKAPLAQRLFDETLDTDAKMQRRIGRPGLQASPGSSAGGSAIGGRTRQRPS